MRALIPLAARPDEQLPGNVLAEEQGIPPKFLEGILAELRRAGIVVSSRGSSGGFRLARDASKISVADVIRAIDGPLAEVRGARPESATYDGSAVHLQEVWIAVRAALRSVLERTSLAQIQSGKLPPNVRRFVEDPDAWEPH